MNLSTEMKLMDWSHQGGGRGGWSGVDWESEVNRCKLLPLKCIYNEILLYSSENYI